MSVCALKVLETKHVAHEPVTVMCETADDTQTGQAVYAPGH